MLFSDFYQLIFVHQYAFQHSIFYSSSSCFDYQMYILQYDIVKAWGKWFIPGNLFELIFFFLLHRLGETNRHVVTLIILFNLWLLLCSREHFFNFNFKEPHPERMIFMWGRGGGGFKMNTNTSGHGSAGYASYNSTI